MRRSSVCTEWAAGAQAGLPSVKLVWAALLLPAAWRLLRLG